jgi:chromosomal replication initiator protein
MKDLTGPKRQKELVLPRHIAMYFLCEEISLTVEHVGKILGGRDHTTVMHGRDRIKKLVHTDREVQKMLIDLKQQALQ